VLLIDYVPDLTVLAQVFVTVLVIMDPLGNVPLFLEPHLRTTCDRGAGSRGDGTG
jgi:hypothetical protein